MGDLNEVVGLDPHGAGFSKLTSEFDLVDVMAHFHPIKNEVATYARGTKRLDYIVCTPNLLSAVTSCGIEPFKEHILSDHRGLFIDWDETLLFGSTINPMAPKACRRLQSTNLIAKGNYILGFHKYCIKHNVFKRLTALQEHPYPSWSRIEKLDKDITRAMLHAEKQCRYLGTDPWSPRLKQARLKVEIYKLALSSTRTGNDYTAQINSLLSSHTELLDLPTTASLIKPLLRVAQLELRGTLKQAASERQKFLQTKQSQALSTNDPKEAAKWKQIKKAEEIKAMYAKLRFIRKDSTQQSGLSRLEVPINPTDDPKQCTEWKTVDSPEAITQYLLERNRKHFGQAAGTPFTVSPLQETVDFGASTHSCELILKGSYESPLLDDLTELLLHHLKLKTPIDFLQPAITETDMQAKFAIWKESTSTSPSGRHLGHYRALLPREMPKDPRARKMEECRVDLVTLHNSMINLALSQGKSYKRWQKVVNIMLEKEPGNPKIHRLRVIHLYEADYNLILSLKARSLVHHAEDNYLLNDGLYGARPGRTAHDPVALEETIAEITRLSRKPCIKNAEDATACYDRIIPGLGHLASRSHGLHRFIAIVQGKTLEEVHYHLKTKLGITDENYQHCKAFPIYGTGQGSGNSPTIWLVVSSILFNCYESRAHGAVFESPDRSIRLQIYRVGFVDDTCGYVNKFEQHIPPTPAEMISLLTHDSQLWSDLLWLSGGALELPKCTYHYWHYYFKPNGAPYLSPGQVGPDVVIRTGDRLNTEIVPYRSVFNAYKTLGYYKSPSGTQTTQHAVLKKKCDNHARIVSTSALTRRDAWTYYFSMYLTSPGYPLPLSHFSPDQLHDLETKSLPALIAKCGFNRNSSRAVLYGPVRFNGGGFRPFSTEQGVGQILYLMKQWTCTLQPGNAQRISVSWAQLNVGVSWSVLDNVTTPLPHFESHWLRVLRDFLSTIQGRIRLDNPYIPSLQRVNDAHIMDLVLQSNLFTAEAICQINYCRLYMQAITISDITTASGTRLFDGINRGLDVEWSSTTKWHSTNQAKPNTASWKLWSQALTLFSKAGALINPLRQWLVCPESQRRSWPFYYDPSTDDLLIPQSGTIYVHHRCCNTFEHDPDGSVPTLPPSAYPVDVIPSFSGWRIRPHFPSSFIPIPPVPPPNTFRTYCDSLEPWEHPLLQSVTLLLPPSLIVDILSHTEFRACSDGSAVFQQGTYGWILALPDKTRLAFGAGPVDGNDPQSFRSEGQGMLSVVRLLHHLRIWTDTTPTFTGILATDNSGLLDRLREQQKIRYPVPNSIFEPDWDIIEAITRTIETSDIEPTFQHVKGHQDEKKAYQDLPFLAQLNVDADYQAGQYQSRHGSHRPIIPLSPTLPIALDIAGRTIHRKFKTAIRDAAHTGPLFQRMCFRNGWSTHVPDSIDWDAHRLATANPLRRTHFVKVCHELLPTGSLVHRYHPSYPEWCPLCKHPTEDHKHVLRCPHITRATWRTALLAKLSKLCTSLQTDPILTAILLNGLRSWLHLLPFDEGGIPSSYHPLLLAQREIGWYHILLGRLSTQWSSLQSKYLHDNSIIIKGLTGDKWAKQIATSIMNSWLELWDSRNKDRHGRDAAHKLISLHDQASRELELLYEYHDKVLQRDRHIFAPDLATHLQKPTRIIRQWINTHQAVILKSSSQAKLLSILNVRTLQSYFQDPP